MWIHRRAVSRLVCTGFNRENSSAFRILAERKVCSLQFLQIIYWDWYLRDFRI